MQEFETSLNRLRTDYVDILMIHSVEPNEDISALESGVYKRLALLKDQGGARFIGFSSMNSAEKSKELLEKLDFDMCLLAINPTQYKNFAEIVLPLAYEKNVGVLAMKVLRDIVGKSASAKELIHYALSQHSVSGVCIAHFGIQKLEENTEIIDNVVLKKMSPVAQAELEYRLAPFAGPHALSYAQPGYLDGDFTSRE